MPEIIPPPAYTDTATPDSKAYDNHALPEYNLPTQFTIGGSKTSAPLVSILQIKGHLALLHAFAQLRKEVETVDFSMPDIPPEKERKWAWFVALAVERYSHPSA